MKKSVTHIQWLFVMVFMLLLSISQVSAENLVDSNNPINPRTNGSMVLNDDNTVTMTCTY